MTEVRNISVRLTPKASIDRVGDVRKMADGQEQLMVYVTSPPDNGKANEAMIRLLAKHFDVAKTRIKLINGHTNRNKLLIIE